MSLILQIHLSCGILRKIKFYPRLVLPLKPTPLHVSFYFFPALIEVGGFEGIRANYPQAASTDTYLTQALYGNLSCGFPPEDAFHIFRPINDPNYPWFGMIFGLTILATDAWCVNQVRCPFSNSHLVVPKVIVTLEELRTNVGIITLTLH